MGAKSTVKITKQQALTFIIQQIMRADDRTIADLVEQINDRLWSDCDFDNTLGLHNFEVVD
jgi:hypothetical protein